MYKMCLNNILLPSAIIVLFSAGYISASSQSSNYNGDTSEWGVTQMKFKRIKYTWTITNYSTYDKTYINHLQSPIFPGDDDDNKWQIHLFLNDLYNGARNVVSLFLMSLSQDNIDIKYKFSLLNKDNRELVEKTTYSTVHRNHLLGYSSYATKDVITSSGNKLLVNDVLTVLVEIVIPVGIANISGHCQFKKSNTSHSDNFLSLLESEVFSDVKLSVGSREFSVHRAILASVSPVFLALFKGNDNIKNQVIKLNYEDPQIFREFLRFIYTGKVEGIEKMGKDLLPLAEKYGIKQLKILCEEVLCKTLKTNNAVDFLILAQNNEAENLKLQASNYIAALDLRDASYTPIYKTLVETSHPLLKMFHSITEKTSTS